MLNQQLSLDRILSGLIALFFVLILQAKWSYSVLPILLALVGVYFYVKRPSKRPNFDRMDKWLIGSILFYFALFVASLLIHGGKVRELDLASRTLLCAINVY